MSICRWSDWEGFECELYIYEDVGGGYTTHVARDCPKRSCGVRPHNGQTFNDATLQELRETLVVLRAVGYKFPDYVLDDIDAEIQEQANGGSNDQA